MSAQLKVPDVLTDSALSVTGVSRHFPVHSSMLASALGAKQLSVKAVDGVSFNIRRGETFSLVGESGCGKSTLARLVAGLDKPTAGAIQFADAEQKGHRIQMIFQDPYASLNPRYRVGTAIAEPIRFQKLLPDAQVMPRVYELLQQVGLSAADATDKCPIRFNSGRSAARICARTRPAAPAAYPPQPFLRRPVRVPRSPVPGRGGPARKDTAAGSAAAAGPTASPRSPLADAPPRTPRPSLRPG